MHFDAAEIQTVTIKAISARFCAQARTRAKQSGLDRWIRSIVGNPKNRRFLRGRSLSKVPFKVPREIRRDETRALRASRKPRRVAQLVVLLKENVRFWVNEVGIPKGGGGGNAVELRCGKPLAASN